MCVCSVAGNITTGDVACKLSTCMDVSMGTEQRIMIMSGAAVHVHVHVMCADIICVMSRGSLVPLCVVGNTNSTSGHNDVEFVSLVVDRIRAAYNTTQFYLSGFSSGGMLTSAVACRYGSLFSGYVPVAAGSAGHAVCLENQNVTSAASMLIVHGLNDNVVDFTSQ